MRRQEEPTSLGRSFRSLLSPQRISRAARETGFVVRKGKINPFKFVWTLVLGFACGRDRSLAGLGRVYQQVTGTILGESSFRGRFGKPLVALLRRLARHLIDVTLLAPHGISGNLAGFADTVIADASVIRLREALEKHFPASRTNHTKSAIKLHLVMSASGRNARSVDITGERVNERRTLRLGPWVRDRLLLLDLGYYGYRLFDRIDRNGGFFISRLKSTANPVIKGAHVSWRGRSVPVIGQKLRDVLPRLRRAVLDVEVEVTFYRRAYRGRRSLARRTLRVVAVRNEETGEYHTYITNVPPDRLTAEEIALAYKARWQIELMFKACKSEFRLDQISSQKREVVEALVYASIITMLVTQELLAFLRSKIADEDARRVTIGRVAASLRAFGQELLRAIVRSLSRSAAELLERLFLREALDPHKNRPTLIEIATGIG